MLGRLLVAVSCHKGNMSQSSGLLIDLFGNCVSETKLIWKEMKRVFPSLFGVFSGRPKTRKSDESGIAEE